MEERLLALQRAVALLETEKKDAERQAARLEKDKDALRNTLDKVDNLSFSQNKCFDRLCASKAPSVPSQVERQKLKCEEGSMRLSAEKTRLDRSLNAVEQELQEAQQQMLMLQVTASNSSAHSTASTASANPAGALSTPK